MKIIKKTKGCDEKFFKTGEMRYFPGITIVNNFTNKKLLNNLKAVQNKYKSLSFYDKLAFLPVDSFHMTVYPLFNFGKKTFKNKELDILESIKTISEFDDYIASKITDIKVPSEITMQAKGFTINNIQLEPKTIDDYNKIWEYRKNVAEEIGIELKMDYKFHITFAYLLEDITDETEIKEWEKLNKELMAIDYSNFSSIELNNIKFTVFNDMSYFREHGQGRENLGIYVDDTKFMFSKEK